MTRRAVILAGGLGTRLRPYTVVLPKPLMPVGDYPILEVIIRQLVSRGFDHITLAVNHQAELIQAFCGDGSKWGVRLDFSLEHERLGTMGPLRLIRDLPDHFLIMNGDVLSDLDFAQFHDSHVQEDRGFTISAALRDQSVDYGVLQTDENDRLSGFDEKPTMRVKVSMGIYMMARRTLRFLPASGMFGFDHLMQAMLAEGAPVRVEPFAGYWLDIGRPDDYMQAIEDFETMKSAIFRD